MLTIKQLKKEAEKHKIIIVGCDEDFYLQVGVLYDKEYDEWKKSYLEKARSAFEKNVAFYKQLVSNMDEKHYNFKHYTEITNRKYKAPSEKSIKDSYKWWVYDNGSNSQLSFREGESMFSCAVPEFGSFNNSKKLEKHWPLLLQWYVRKSKQKFFKCSVIDKPEWKALNTALKDIGFEKRAACKSRHGKYFVNVWEYIKK